jgi:hypothetical protein
VKTLSVRVCEEQTLWIVRDSIEINVSEYPELNGMTEDEMVEYIKNNSSEMAAPSGFNTYNNDLSSVLFEQDVVREKDTSNNTFIYVNEK